MVLWGFCRNFVKRQPQKSSGRSPTGDETEVGKKALHEQPSPPGTKVTSPSDDTDAPTNE